MDLLARKVSRQLDREPIDAFRGDVTPFTRETGFFTDADRRPVPTYPPPPPATPFVAMATPTAPPSSQGPSAPKPTRVSAAELPIHTRGDLEEMSVIGNALAGAHAHRWQMHTRGSLGASNFLPKVFLLDLSNPENNGQKKSFAVDVQKFQLAIMYRNFVENIRDTTKDYLEDEAQRAIEELAQLIGGKATFHDDPNLDKLPSLAIFLGKKTPFGWLAAAERRGETLSQLPTGEQGKVVSLEQYKNEYYKMEEYPFMLWIAARTELILRMWAVCMLENDRDYRVLLWKSLAPYLAQRHFVDWLPLMSDSDRTGLHNDMVGIVDLLTSMIEGTPFEEARFATRPTFYQLSQVTDASTFVGPTEAMQHLQRRGRMFKISSLRYATNIVVDTSTNNLCVSEVDRADPDPCRRRNIFLMDPTSSAATRFVSGWSTRYETPSAAGPSRPVSTPAVRAPRPAPGSAALPWATSRIPRTGALDPAGATGFDAPQRVFRLKSRYEMGGLKKL